jgi:hypothetical protein
LANNNYNGKIGDVDTVNNDWMLRIISKGLIHLMTIYLVIF